MSPVSTEDPRLEAVGRYNAALQSDRLGAMLALCDAFEASAVRLAEPSEVPDPLDLTVTLLAAEACISLDRRHEAGVFCEAAEIYARRIPGHSGRAWLAKTVACRARGAIEFGDAGPAHAAIAGFDSRLIGILASGNLQEIEIWEQGETWIGAYADEISANGWAVLASLYHVVALLLMASGELLASLFVAQRGLQHLRARVAAQTSMLSARLEFAEAMALLQLGRLEAVRQLPFLQPEVAAEFPPPVMGNRLLVRARLAVLSGWISEAVDSMRELGDLAKAAGSAFDLARWRLRAAALLIYVNQPRRAELLLALVSESEVAGDPAISLQLRHLQALGVDRSAMSDPGGAVPVSWHDRAPAPPPEIDSLGDTDLQPLTRRLGIPAYDLEAEFSEWSTRIRRMLDYGHADEASAALERCRGRFRSVSSPLISARLTFLAVIVNAVGGKGDDLVFQALAAAAAFHRIGAPLDELQGLRLVLSLAGEETEGSAQIRARVNELLGLVTIGLDPLSTELFIEDKTTSRDRLLERELLLLRSRQGHSNLLVRLLRCENAETVAVRQIFRRARATRIRGRPDAVFPRWSVARVEWTSLSTAGAALTFVVLPNVTIMVRRSQTVVDWRIVDVSAAWLRLLVTRWHHLNNEWWYATSGKYGIATAAMALVAEKIHQQLDAVAEELATVLGLESEFVSNKAPLCVEPDGPLINFPFSALRLGGRYLVQCRPIANRFTYHQSKQAGAPPQTGLAISIAGALVVPSLSLQQQLSFEALPSAKRESKVAAAWFSRQGFRTKRLSDEQVPPDASREELLSMMAASSHMHFAGHGTFNAASRKDSGLVVPNRKGEGTLLSMADIEELSSVPRYVAITSCYSADSISIPGGQALGLTQSMLRAGATTVLASFWRVTDRVSERLVARYYRLCTDQRYVAALADAQRQAIAGKIRVPGILNVSHPYCWAGFAIHQRVQLDVW